MKLDNPGLYKCKGKGSYELHWWIIKINGTSHCRFCRIKLTKKQTKELKL